MYIGTPPTLVEFRVAKSRATRAWPLQGLASTTRGDDLEEAKIGPEVSPARPTDFRSRDADNHTRQTMRCLVRRESFQIEVRTGPTHGLQPRRMGGLAHVLGRWLVHADGRWKMRNEICVALHDLVSPRHLTCIYDLIGPTPGGGGCPFVRVTGVTMCVRTSRHAETRPSCPARKIDMDMRPGLLRQPCS